MADDADQPGQPTLVGPTATDHRPGSLHLVVGAPAPQQLDGRTCGPTALTTARMLRDPALADWVRTGATHGRAFPDGASAQVRLAAYHALVHARTNALVGPGGRLQVPWPRALGTTPWGVCRELEAGAAAPGTRYRTVTVRWATRDRRAELVEALADHLGPGRPGILFIGSAVLPRHVALLVPGPDGRGPRDHRRRVGVGDGGVRATARRVGGAHDLGALRHLRLGLVGSRPSALIRSGGPPGPGRAASPLAR